MLNIAPLEFWLILQMSLEALLLLFLVVLLVRLRRGRSSGAQVPENVQASIERFLAESEKLSAHFTENLLQKKELSLGLLLKLERKINEMNRLLERAETSLSQADRPSLPAADPHKANPAAPENRALVVKLANQGKSVEEIARTARLHRGEVELILDLERQFKI